MKGTVVSLALRVAVALSLLAVAPTQAATKISQFGYVITAPGTYQVTQDLGPGSGNAITVLTGNVALHLGGHTLTGAGSGAGVDVEGPAGNNVTIDHGTVQGFQDGIFLNNAANCQVSHVTASQNSRDGILILNTASNTVTDSTASQNGDKGIQVFGSSGNTLTRNTANGNNNLGISFEFGSYGNTAVHNTTNANKGTGGIVLAGGTTQNTVLDNTCNGNFIGIEVGVYGFGEASGNTIQNNTANQNVIGIQLVQNSSDNTLQGNTALTNGSIDLEDDNSNCDSNTWANNKFVTDLVAGVNDGGPGTGCIR
jgi:parallel beta-helix repeat protein